MTRMRATLLVTTALAIASGMVSSGSPVVSVTLSQTTITGGTGGVSIGTVTISAPAPAGGQVVNLTSSNTDLAASTPSLIIPEGATSASFSVGTNSLYRRYSGLAFDATITATNPGDGSSASAILHVTAQPRPGPFTGGTNSADARAQAGNICGGAFGSGSASERGILYRCEFPQAGAFSVCSFLQECSFGCQTQAAPHLSRNDVCAASPLFPVAVDPELLEGGRRSDGSVFLDAPATSLTSATVNASPVGEIAPGGVFPVPEGATTAPFDVDTFEVAVPAFVQVRADLSLNPLERFAQDYLAVVPAAGSGPSPGPLAVFSVDTTPMAVVQGNPSIGTVILSSVAPSGGAVVSLSTDNPAASVPATVTVPAGQTATSFGVTTFGVSAPTRVTIIATIGGVSRSTTMTVSPFIFSTTTPALADFAVTPTIVVGGTRSTGRVSVTTPAPDPSNGVVSVALTSDNEAVVVVARSVKVGHGGTIADFRVRTFAVTQSTLVTLMATYNGVTRSATLTVNPSGPPPPLALSAVSVNPTMVVGGNPSTGMVTLNAVAPSGGVSVALSTDTVAIVPASVTVPVGQTSASFTVSTAEVAAPTAATITGTFDGTSRSATLTINPPPPPAALSALSVSPTTVVGGNSSSGTVTLSAAAPSGGVVVSLSDNSTAASVPANVTVAAGATSATFTVTTTSVATSTSTTISATLGGDTRTAALTVNPPPTPSAPSLVSPANDATPAQPVTLDWTDVANATSYEVQVDDSSTIAAPFVENPTATGSQVTLGSLPAQRLWWRVRARNSAGVFGPFSAMRRFTPQAAPAAATLSSVAASPSSVVGGNGSTGTATLTAAAPIGGAVVALSSSNTAVASVPTSVIIAAGSTSATFAATTSAVTTSTAVTITATYSGVSRSTTLTVTPVPPPASLQGVSVSPSSVTGGTNSSGTVTLSSAAPTGGATVALSSSHTTVATVPASVTVAAGATSATFTATTASVGASTPVTISATYGGVTRTTTLTVNPPGQAATLTVTATGRSGERVTSSPAGINVNVGSNGSASFATGTAITLSVTNGRDAIWSGACSSGGNKTKTCTFTLGGTATVMANVQ